MAFKRKDIKKASYYVWFLGAKESKGLRGDEYVVPVLSFLIDKERQFEPSKVTLQVSNKGIKIVQTLTVPKKSGNTKSTNIFNSTTSPKTEQIKHMIPHHSITWVSQEEDIICSILLIYNPITKCPVHVHAYRCDSIETATTLRNQLQILIDRPENQKKFREIEMRLAAKGLMPNTSPIPPGLEFVPPRKPLNSDGRSTRTEGSENSDESIGSSDLGYNGKELKSAVTKISRTHKSENNCNTNDISNGQVSTLYESLAAELRAKLGNPKTGPILLPPRDYDTISRRRGKLEGIEFRKSTNTQIVGPLEHNLSPITRSESSGKSSSGIGSDEALSSAIHETHSDYDRKAPHISSDEENIVIERKERPNHELSPDRNLNYSPLKKVGSRKPIAQNFERHRSERKCESNDSLSATIPKPYKPVTPIANQSTHIQKYYFPDPAFSVPDAQHSHLKKEQRLQRRKSNPDYFHQMRPISPHNERSPPLERLFEKQGSNYRDSRGPDYNYSREEPITRYRERTEPRKDYNNRHSFVETPLRRFAPQH
jgi:hypothetical protein